MKWKIVQQLDRVSEQAIKEVLELLEQADKKAKIRYDLTTNVDQLRQENDELLKRLA